MNKKAYMDYLEEWGAKQRNKRAKITCGEKIRRTNHFGRDLTVESIDEAARIINEGSSVQRLRETARRAGGAWVDASTPAMPDGSEERPYPSDELRSREREQQAPTTRGREPENVNGGG